MGVVLVAPLCRHVKMFVIGRSHGGSVHVMRGERGERFGNMPSCGHVLVEKARQLPLFGRRIWTRFAISSLHGLLFGSLRQRL